MDIKEIALRIAESIDDGSDEQYFVDQDGWITEFAEALIAEIAKQNEPVVTLKSDDFGWGIWEDNLEHKPAGSILNLYTFPPTAEQIANETAWQPIETAPKDGSAILVGRFLNSDGQAYCNGRIAVDWYRGPELTWGMFNKKHWPATHWMPLPTPPKQSMEGV